MKKLNNKGFTLVEVLAVLVILSAIMGIALPSITSSMERNKDKQDKHKKEMLASFAEIYVANHRNSLYNWMTANSKDECYISIGTLKAEKNLLSDGATEDSDGNEIGGVINFNRTSNSYKHYDSVSEITNPIECRLN